jgi:exopolyphosphatase / guanosine-5'-triphosphate,3'-diphosphate pyrophosphatase
VPRFAAIDVGSNALRLRVVEADAPTEVRELSSERSAVRLGREVFLQGRLAPNAVSQASEALRRFREILDLHRVERYRAVATSAVREAENGSILVERARREAGIELDVIEGIEEARLVRLAIVSRLDLREKRALLLDLGGGSLELSLIERGQLRVSKSLPIGTVRLLEAFHAKTDAGAEELAREYIERQLLEVASEIPPGVFDAVVGTGGNFDTLAQLCPPATPDPARPTIDVEALRALLPKLSAMSPDERRAAYGLRPDRADVIVPAAEIVIGVAKAFGIQQIHAPGVGLKEGVLDELIEKHFDVWDYGG